MCKYKHVVVAILAAQDGHDVNSKNYFTKATLLEKVCWLKKNGFSFRINLPGMVGPGITVEEAMELLPESEPELIED